MLRTVDSVSPISLSEVAFSCTLILIIYCVVFGVGIRYLLAMMANPPSLSETPPPTDAPQRTQGITPGPAGGTGRSGGPKPSGTLGVPAE